MLEIYRQPATRQDELDIWLHVALDSPDVADRLLDRFDEAVRRLAIYPLSGRSRDELGDGIRSSPVGAYTVFYRVETTRLIIVRILSSYRDIADPALFEA